MPYYHIFIETDGDEKKEHDLSKKELESLVESYHRNKKFMCGGSFVQPSEIETTQIYETQENLETFLEGKRPLFTFLMPDESLLKKYGRTVTKLFIKHPPRKRRTKKVLKREGETLKTRILSKNVFIVHGRDTEPVKELKAMLSEFGLNPIVLHELPSGSMTIIEKLEKYSEDVGFAFAVLTPDDVGFEFNRFQSLLRTATFEHDQKRWFLEETITHELKPRTRQNVLLEFGFFMGKLSRSNVCCLYKGNVDLPSDMQGIVYKHFNNSVNEVRDKIIKELKAAGYEIRI